MRVGLALGRGDQPGIMRSGWVAWSVGVAFMAAMAAVMWAIPHQLVVLFLDDSPANALVIGLAVSFLGYWGVGLGIGSWLAFAADWKGVGIWIGLASGLAAVAALMLARWMMRARLGLTAYRSTYTMSSRSVSA